MNFSRYKNVFFRYLNFMLFYYTPRGEGFVWARKDDMIWGAYSLQFSLLSFNSHVLYDVNTHHVQDRWHWCFHILIIASTYGLTLKKIKKKKILTVLGNSHRRGNFDGATSVFHLINLRDSERVLNIWYQPKLKKIERSLALSYPSITHPKL